MSVKELLFQVLSIDGKKIGSKNFRSKQAIGLREVWHWIPASFWKYDFELVFPSISSGDFSQEGVILIKDSLIGCNVCLINVSLMKVLMMRKSLKYNLMILSPPRGHHSCGGNGQFSRKH